MIDLNEYVKGCYVQAITRDWNTDFPWLGTKLTIEVGEFLKAIEEKKAPAEIMMEWCDVQYVLSQLMYYNYPKANLEKALKVLFGMNATMKKKTWDGKRVIRK